MSSDQQHINKTVRVLKDSRLKPIELVCRQSSKNSVAVLQPCQDQRHYQSDKRLPADRATDAVKLTAKHPATTSYITLCRQRQAAVNPDFEVTHDRRKMDRISPNDDWRNRQLMQTLTRVHRRNSCLGHVQLQAVCIHPFSRESLIGLVVSLVLTRLGYFNRRCSC